MVRLVFRPYTQIRRTICTSVSLRASTLFRHRSPSFGSQQICYYSNLPQANDRSIVPPTRGRDSYLKPCGSLLSLRIRVCHPGRPTNVFGLLARDLFAFVRAEFQAEYGLSNTGNKTPVASSRVRA